MGENSQVTKAATTPMQPRLVNVVIRRQTAEEEARFRVALDIFLSEMVRQELHRGGEGHE